MSYGEESEASEAFVSVPAAGRATFEKPDERKTTGPSTSEFLREDKKRVFHSGALRLDDLEKAALFSACD